MVRKKNGKPSRLENIGDSVWLEHIYGKPCMALNLHSRFFLGQMVHTVLVSKVANYWPGRDKTKMAVTKALARSMGSHEACKQNNALWSYACNLHMIIVYRSYHGGTLQFVFIIYLHTIFHSLIQKNTCRQTSIGSYASKSANWIPSTKCSVVKLVVFILASFFTSQLAIPIWLVVGCFLTAMPYLMGPHLEEAVYPWFVAVMASLVLWLPGLHQTKWMDHQLGFSDSAMYLVRSITEVVATLWHPSGP